MSVVQPVPPTPSCTCTPSPSAPSLLEAHVTHRTRTPELPRFNQSLMAAIDAHTKLDTFIYGEALRLFRKIDDGEKKLPPPRD